MKNLVVFVLFAISAIVKGAFWAAAAAAEPLMQMLGIGTAFAAWNIANNKVSGDSEGDQPKVDMEPKRDPLGKLWDEGDTPEEIE